MQPFFGIVWNGTISLNSNLNTAMDRRNKTRHSLQLICRAESGTVRSSMDPAAAAGTPEGITENMSRDGILMRWLDVVPLPEIGSPLTVEVELPEDSEFGPRVMRCKTTVVRITRRQDGQRSVGLRIDHVRFNRARFNRATKARTVAASAIPDLALDLATMTPATDKVN